MAGNLTRKLLALMALFAAFGTSYAADVLQDPTRPPPGLYTGEGDSAQTGEPILQSVFISPRHRSAIISGQAVVVGDKVGTAQVVAIRDQEVVLREGKDLQTLRLFPNLEKAGAEKSGKPAKKGQKQ